MSKVIKCGDCLFFVEKHYEEDGEEPYIKYACKNKYGMPKYAVKPYDYCSRAKEKNPMPSLNVGDILTSNINRTFIAVAEGYVFNVTDERVDSLSEILEKNDIVDVSRVDDYGVRLLVWSKED